MKGLYTTDSKESNLKIYVHPPGSLSCMRVCNKFFRYEGFALLDGRDSGFLSKMGRGGGGGGIRDLNYARDAGCPK